MTEVTEGTKSPRRVSNERILSALEGLPAAIAAAMAPAQADAPAEIANASKGEQVTAAVDPAYLAHVGTTLQDRANLNNMTYVMYVRKNKAGETKLAYCAADKWSALTDRRIIGAVKTVSPE